MNKDIKGLLIDPKTKSITETTLHLLKGQSWPSIANLIGCEEVEQICRLNNGDFVFADNEGLLEKSNNSFQLNNIPVFGSALIINFDDDEEAGQDCKSTLEEIRTSVIFHEIEVTKELRLKRRTLGWTTIPSEALPIIKSNIEAGERLPRIKEKVDEYLKSVADESTKDGLFSYLKTSLVSEDYNYWKSYYGKLEAAHRAIPDRPKPFPWMIE